MRILHLGMHLPDARVEKIMRLDASRGDELGIVIYAGRNNGLAFEESRSVKIFEFNIKPREVIGFNKIEVSKRLKQIILDFDPDFIHVHDIFNAVVYVNSGLELPWIYNDHEGWSMDVATRRPIWTSFRSYAELFFMWKHVREWEKIVIKDRVTITVSHNIGLLHKKLGADNINIMHNYPMLNEIPYKIEDVLEKIEFSTLYIGADLGKKKQRHERNTTGFLPLVKKHKIDLTVVGDNLLESNETIKSLGYKPHLKLYGYMKDMQFGLLPYQPHSYHINGDPNKGYLYPHMGLILIGPELYPLRNIPAFRRYHKMKELPSLITRNVQDHEHPDVIMKHARKNLIFDNQIKELDNAMKRAYEILG